MKRLSVQANKNDQYDVLIATGLLEDMCCHFRSRLLSDVLTIVTDTTVNQLYGKRIEEILTEGGYQVIKHVIQGGEKDKSLQVVMNLTKELLDNHIHRRCTIIAFGGGVVTDLTGFVASIYMRGIDYVNIPTTLLAQLDAGVGGKTAVNLPVAKNIIGSFHHPCLVLNDPQLLTTLSDTEIACGVAEAVKVAVINSGSLFNYLEANACKIKQKDLPSLTHIVNESVRIKLNLLEPDPYENDLRRTLNFGHCIGHALESHEEYERISHGSAISIGMATATRLSCHRGLCSKASLTRIEQLLKQFGLPTTCNHSSRISLLTFLKNIQLIRGGAMNVVLPLDIGRSIVAEDVTADELYDFIH